MQWRRQLPTSRMCSTINICRPRNGIKMHPQQLHVVAAVVNGVIKQRAMQLRKGSLNSVHKMHLTAELPCFDSFV